MVDRGWVQSMQNADNIYIITEGGPKETKYLPTRESTTFHLHFNAVYKNALIGIIFKIFANNLQKLTKYS